MQGATWHSCCNRYCKSLGLQQLCYLSVLTYAAGTLELSWIMASWLASRPRKCYACSCFSAGSACPRLHLGVADGVAAGTRLHVLAVESLLQGAQLVVLDDLQEERKLCVTAHSLQSMLHAATQLGSELKTHNVRWVAPVTSYDSTGKAASAANSTVHGSSWQIASCSRV